MRKADGCFGGGCCLFVAGLVAGASLMVLAVVAWGLVRPVNPLPLENRIARGDVDLEVRLSEAYLNREIARELAERDLRTIARIVVDAREKQRLDATLEGSFELGGIVPPTPRLETEILLGVDGGFLSVYIARMGIGPVSVVRDTVPELLQPLFESVEDTIAKTINEELLEVGYRVQSVQSDEESLTLGLREHVITDRLDLCICGGGWHDYTTARKMRDQ